MPCCRDCDHTLRGRPWAVLFLPALAAALAAQTAISVRPGLIHHSEGEVVVRDTLEFRSSSGRYRHLEEGQHLISHQGRSEVFLNLGTAMRLGEHGDVEMVKAELDEIQVRLVQGSAVFEVRDKKGMDTISVFAGDRTVRFDKKGLYRVEHPSGETPVLKVFRGLATVSSANEEQQVRPKQLMVLAAVPEGLAAQAFDRSKKDALDKWQRERAERIATDERAREQGRGPSATNSDLLWSIYRSQGGYRGQGATVSGSSGGSAGGRAPTSGGGGASTGTASGGSRSSPRGRVGSR